MSDESTRVPPAHLRIVGQVLTRLIARRPATWRLLRRPVRRFFERLADGWDERVRPDDPEHLAGLAAALEGLPAPADALDLGTGTGAAALYLARRYPEARVVGVDISEAMVDQARAKAGSELAGRVRFEVSDASALALADRSFDLVVQVSVPPFFAEIARVLRPGGHAVVVSSLGAATPFHTPKRDLERGFRAHGLEPVAAGKGGPGTYFTARLPS